METRDVWEQQVNVLTKHCRSLNERIDGLEQRLGYFENVVLVLIKALKDGGVIVPASDGEHSFE